ncbi:MAG TPA: ATP-binding protein [Dermatophilaceae bacterium]|nr:ATP-binding protein [Dermatophilaceae bacterium]
MGQVAVLEVAGRLDDAVEELDLAIQLALAETPRGVVCDLSGVLEGAEPGAVEVLATAGRHVRDWPGIPVAVACPNPWVHEALRAHPLGGQLITAESVSCAMRSVLATPHLIAQCLHLAAHPTAPRAARNFVTRTLLDWQLARIIPFASLLVSELVASSAIHSGTDIDLSVVWDREALRLTVGDHGPALPGQRSVPRLHGRGLTVVAGLSRAFGNLPAADGGDVVWAVLEAPRPRPSAGKHLGNVGPEQVKSLGIAKAI